MIELPPDLDAQVSALMEESTEAFRSGQGGLGHATLNEAWRLLPEPRAEVDFFSQTLSVIGVESCRDAGLFEEAFIWLERARAAYAVTMGADSPYLVDGYEVTVRYEAQTPDAAEFAKRVLKQWGSDAFQGMDPKYLRFAQTGERTGGATPAAASGSAPKELDSARIEQLSEQGTDLLDDDDWEGALRAWQQALELVPEPKTDHGEATWLYTSIGDAYHSGERWADAVDALQTALTCPDGTGMGYLWLRLGECQYELNDLDAATNSLLSAYMLEGDEIFEDEDPKYRRLLVQRGQIDG